MSISILPFDKRGTPLPEPARDASAPPKTPTPPGVPAQLPVRGSPEASSYKDGIARTAAAIADAVQQSNPGIGRQQAAEFGLKCATALVALPHEVARRCQQELFNGIDHCKRDRGTDVLSTAGAALDTMVGGYYDALRHQSRASAA